MANRTLILKPEILLAVKVFAAQKDVRSHINGVCLELGTTESRLIATDGHREAIYRLRDEGFRDLEQPIQVIIPNELLAGIKKKGLVEIQVGEPGDPEKPDVYSVTVTQNGTSVSGLSVDGRFPDWRRVLPAKISGEVAQFNPVYLGDIGKAYKLLNPGAENINATIAHNGNSVSLFTLDDDNFIGLIMPYKTSEPPTATPAWAQQ
jgi:DNA polymerase-3 subunit beta